MPVEDNAFYAQGKGLASMAPSMPRALASVLLKVDNSVFRQSERAYKVFKDFDIDKDGKLP